MYSTHRIGILTGVLSLLLLSSSPAAAETTAGTTLTPAAAVVVTQGNVSDGSLEITFGGGYPFPDQCYDPDDNYVDYCLNNYPNIFSWGDEGYFFLGPDGVRHFWHGGQGHHHDHGQAHGHAAHAHAAHAHGGHAHGGHAHAAHGHGGHGGKQHK